MDDREVVQAQIGRPTRSEVVVELRCHLDLPVVIGVAPILDDGTPFPTSHWLTCPLATRRISRLESSGGVRAADARIAAQPEMATAWKATMSRYKNDRDEALPDGWEGPKPSGGVAGSRWGVKCLHAQYADSASGHDNPIGQDVQADVEPLDCTDPCVALMDGTVRLNPDWIEPR